MHEQEFINLSVHSIIICRAGEPLPPGIHKPGEQYDVMKVWEGEGYTGTKKNIYTLNIAHSEVILPRLDILRNEENYWLPSQVPQRAHF
jgi:hypothetical protein